MRLLIAALFLLQSGALPVGSAETARTPVVVELFTAEGCSSCPPADELLAKLDREQPVPGVTIIALEEHVDYWDQQGWRDRFSSPEFTARQQQFADVLRVDNIFTPQMVVDGRSQFVGNDPHRAWQEIAGAAQNAKTSVRAAVKGTSGNRLSLAVHVEAAASPADVLLAITETSLSSEVAAGENAGRNLQHAAVVRRLTNIGKLKAGETFDAAPAIKLSKSWKPENMRAVVLLEDRATRKVLGAAEVALLR
jgi:hypothetical protein